MEFYAFLPSNGSPEMYSDNKTSHFKIEFAQRIDLQGRWQVAMIDLHYPNTVAQVVEGDNEIVLQTDKSQDIVAVRRGNYANRQDFYLGVQDALRVFTNDVSSQAITESLDHRVTIPPIIDDPQAKVFFSPSLALQLGLDNTGPYPAHKEVLGVKPVDISLGTPPQMFVYMDVVSDQIVGHTRVPLLRTVPLNTTANYGSLSTFHCDHPLYFDLKTQSFDTVEINIRDHAGRFIPFDHGTLTLLVHFKRVA